MRSEAQKYYIQHNLCGALDYDAILNRNELRGKADGAGLPTYTVADAGRTQVAAGSKTVLVIGPGTKASVDTLTRHLRLL